MLERQACRMLADERSKALVENFGRVACSCRISGVALNPSFPEAAFDEVPRGAFRRERELFVEPAARGPRR